MAEGSGCKYTIAAQMVCPAIPMDPNIQKQLEEDLMNIGCFGLIQRLWTLKNEKMIQKLLIGAPNQYELIVKGRPIIPYPRRRIYGWMSTDSRRADLD